MKTEENTMNDDVRDEIQKMVTDFYDRTNSRKKTWKEILEYANSPH